MTTPSEMIWEEPPPTAYGNRRSNWKPILDALRERPGEWALVKQDASHGTCAPLKGRFPEFEFTQRAIKGTDRIKIYARYNPAVKA